MVSDTDSLTARVSAGSYPAALHSGLSTDAPNVTAAWLAAPSSYTHNLFHAVLAGK